MLIALCSSCPVRHGVDYASKTTSSVLTSNNSISNADKTMKFAGIIELILLMYYGTKCWNRCLNYVDSTAPTDMFSYRLLNFHEIWR